MTPMRLPRAISLGSRKRGAALYLPHRQHGHWGWNCPRRAALPGSRGSHPELGHHVIDPSGPLCFCGARGCWESLASGPALALRGGRATALEVCEAARQGNGETLAAVEQEGAVLGIGLANLVTMFVPDVIALGGGVMQSWDLFTDKITAIIRTSCGLVPYEKTRLLPASLGRDAGLVGAAQVWIKRYGQ